MKVDWLNPDDPTSFFVCCFWLVSVVAAWLHGDKTGRAAERHVIERDEPKAEE